jgi:hypothetical protein
VNGVPPACPHVFGEPTRTLQARFFAVLNHRCAVNLSGQVGYFGGSKVKRVLEINLTAQHIAISLSVKRLRMRAAVRPILTSSIVPGIRRKISPASVTPNSAIHCHAKFARFSDFWDDWDVRRPFVHQGVFTCCYTRKEACLPSLPRMMPLLQSRHMQGE